MTNISKNSVNIKLESTKLILKYLPTFYLYENDVRQKYRENIDKNSGLKKAIKEGTFSYEQFLYPQLNKSIDKGYNIHFDVINQEGDEFKFNFINKATQDIALEPYRVQKSIIIQNDKSKAREFSIKNIEKQLFNVDFHNVDFSKINSELGNLSEKLINMVDFKLEVVDIDHLVSLHKGNLNSTPREVYRSIHDLSHLEKIQNKKIQEDNSMLDNSLNLKRTTSLPLFTSFDEASSIKFNFHTDAKFKLEGNVVSLVDTTLTVNYHITAAALNDTLIAFKNESINVVKEALYSPNKGLVRFVLEYDLFDKKDNSFYSSIPTRVFDRSHHFHMNNNYKSEGYQLLLSHPEVNLEGVKSKNATVLVKTIDFENSEIKQKQENWDKNHPTTKISRYRKTISFEIEDIVKNLFKLNEEESYKSLNTFNGISDYISYNIKTYYSHLNRSESEEVKVDLIKRFNNFINKSTILSNKIKKNIKINTKIKESSQDYSRRIGEKIFNDLEKSGVDLKSDNRLDFVPTTGIRTLKQDRKATKNEAVADEALGNYKTFLYVSKNNKVEASEVDSDALWGELSTDIQRTSFTNEGLSFRDEINEAKKEVENVPLILSFAKLNNVSEESPLGKKNLSGDPHIEYPNGSFNIVKSHRRGNVQPRLLMLIRKATIALKRKFDIVEKVIINSRSSMDIPTWVQIATINATEYSKNNKANIKKKIEEIKRIIPGLGIDEKNYKRFIKILAGRYNNGLDPNHSGGYGVDIKIKLKSKGAQRFMCLWKPNTDKDFEIAAYFSKVCKMLGANGIGAAIFYADYPEPVQYRSARPPLGLKPGLSQYDKFYITENGVYKRKINSQNWNEIHIDILKVNTALLGYLENNKDNLNNEIFSKFNLKTSKVMNNLKSNLRGWGQDFTSNTIETWLSSAIGVRNRKLNRENYKTYDRSFDISGKADLTHGVPSQIKKYASVELSVIQKAEAKKDKKK